MKKLLSRTVKTFTLYALLVLTASVPVYYYLVDTIWLTELDEHNEIIADKTQGQLKILRLADAELAHNIAFWNQIQPGTSLEPVGPTAPLPDSTYTVRRRHPLVQNNELKRYRGLARLVQVNNRFYRLRVETNVEETEETVLAIALITFLFFLILVVGFLLLNRRLSVRLWKPFRSTLALLKTFNLNNQTPVTFEPTTTLEFDELNDALRKLIDHTIVVYRSQKEFTENASHEMQTPLAILKNKLDLLLQKEPVTDRQYQLIEEMNRTLTRISCINKNLLLLAKIENQQFSDTERVDLSDLTQQCLDVLSEPIHASEITVCTTLTDNVWLDGNRTLLEILVNNLLGNATRHNRPQGELRVGLTDRALVVSSSGHQALPGESLFDRFRVGSAKTAGSGLGLAIVRKICIRHDWRVDYQFDGSLHIFSVQF